MFKVGHAHHDLEDLTMSVIRPYCDLHDRTTIIKIIIFFTDRSAIVALLFVVVLIFLYLVQFLVHKLGH